MLTPGKNAPAFELTGTDGKQYSLQGAVKRGAVLLAFFKVNCPTCQYTFPFVEKIHRHLHTQGAQIWGIAQDDARDSQRFAKEYGATFPILLDEDNYEVSRAYGLEYVPTLFLIDADGHVAVASEGFCRADLLEIQKSLAHSLGASPGTLFQPAEKIPEYKPG